MRELQYGLCAAGRAIAVLVSFLMLSAGSLKAQQSMNIADGDNIIDHGALALQYDGSHTKEKLNSASTGEEQQPAPEPIAISDKAATLAAHPTPTRDVLTISGASGGSYTIVDMFGRILETGPLTDNRIDIRNFATGVYLALVTTSGNGIRSVKFTKH